MSNLDHRIEKFVKPECPGHDYPSERNYGIGTLAHCGNCGLIAELSDGGYQNDLCWAETYPKQYADKFDKK